MDLYKEKKALYKFALREQWEYVGEVCKDARQLVLPINNGGDTALHLAVHSGKEEPLKTFLAQVMEMEYTEHWKSYVENTPLHEAASVGNLGAVKLLVELRKEDLLEVNIWGETPLYRAARYGKLDIVQYILNDCEDFYARSSLNWTAKGTPIIHAAIQSENFEMVMMLVDFDKSLLEMKDTNNKTALHVLANMPHIFESGYVKGFWAELIYYWLPKDPTYNFNFCKFGYVNNNDSTSLSNKDQKFEDLEAGFDSKPKHNWCFKWSKYLGQSSKRLLGRFIVRGWLECKELYMKKKKHKLILRITEMLVDIDLSCYQEKQKPDSTLIDRSEKAQEPIVDGKSIEYKDHHETPLLLAAARGIIEVVERIIEAHPEAVDYVTEKDRNILHVLIAHRQLKIFEWIQRQKLIMHRLARRIDVLGYTVLHHVGITKFLSQSTLGPAIQLQHELEWFDRVHNVLPLLYNIQYSKNQWNPREFFDETHKDMLDKAKEWIKKTSESCSAVAVLMATVAFAAAFTVPGGLNSKTGSPILLSDPIYLFFAALDITSLISSLSSLVLFLLILTSPFEIDTFRHELTIQLSLGFNLLFLSVASTMIAFAVAIVLTMKSTNMVWAECLLFLVTLAPIVIFVVMKLPLLLELEKSIWKGLQFLWKLLPMGFLTIFFEIPSKFLSNKST